MLHACTCIIPVALRAKVPGVHGKYLPEHRIAYERVLSSTNSSCPDVNVRQFSGLRVASHNLIRQARPQSSLGRLPRYEICCRSTVLNSLFRFSQFQFPLLLGIAAAIPEYFWIWKFRLQLQACLGNQKASSLQIVRQIDAVIVQ